MNRRVWIALVLLLALGVPVALAPRFWRETTFVERGPLADQLVLRAAVVAADGSAQVGARGDGRVLKVFVREGDRVERGQALAEYEPAGAGPEPSVISAPIAGTVLARRIDAGDSIAAVTQAGGAALFELADDDKLEVRAEIEERDLLRVRNGLEASLTTPGGLNALGRGAVTRISARVERSTLAEDDVRVRADSPVRALWIAWHLPVPKLVLGQRLEARIRLPEKPVATRVPRNAIVVHEGRSVVETPWLLWSREVPVVVGAADEGLAEVAGVEPGMRVFLH